MREEEKLFSVRRTVVFRRECDGSVGVDYKYLFIHAKKRISVSQKWHHSLLHPPFSRGNPMKSAVGEAVHRSWERKVAVDPGMDFAWDSKIR